MYVRTFCLVVKIAPIRDLWIILFTHLRWFRYNNNKLSLGSSTQRGAHDNNEDYGQPANDIIRLIGLIKHNHHVSAGFVGGFLCAVGRVSPGQLLVVISWNDFAADPCGAVLSELFHCMDDEGLHVDNGDNTNPHHRGKTFD